VTRLLGVVVAACLALTGCAGARIRSASDTVKIVEDLPYITGSIDPKQKLDLYVPRSGTQLPVVLFVHGGFWKGQDRRYYQAFTGIYGNVGVTLARQGFLVAVPSYRLSPAVGIKDQLADVLAALRWVATNAPLYGGDPSRVVLVGYSAGGHLVTLLSMDRSYLAADEALAGHLRGVVSISGILDVHAMAEGQDAAFNEEVTYRLFGRTAETQAVLSPSTYLRGDAPPFLSLAAERDYPFVISAGRSVAARLASLGAQASFHQVAGYDHSDMVLGINTKGDAVSPPVLDFLTRVTRVTRVTKVP
jgi:acetyl esterase/lipase